MVWHGTLINRSSTVFLQDDQWSALEQLAITSEYWRTAASFLYRMNDRLLSSLTDRQKEWYEELHAELNVQVDRREARIAFGLEPDYDDQS